MGFADESKRPAIVFDLEAVPMDGAAAFLEPIEAPNNYSKPEAIARYVEKATAEQLSKCALDVDLARIVAIGLMKPERSDAVTVRLCKTEDEEREALEYFWSEVRPFPYSPLIGFAVCQYDLPMLL